MGQLHNFAVKEFENNNNNKNIYKATTSMVSWFSEWFIHTLDVVYCLPLPHPHQSTNHQWLVRAKTEHKISGNMSNNSFRIHHSWEVSCEIKPLLREKKYRNILLIHASIQVAQRQHVSSPTKWSNCFFYFLHLTWYFYKNGLYYICHLV